MCTTCTQCIYILCYTCMYPVYDIHVHVYVHDIIMCVIYMYMYMYMKIHVYRTLARLVVKEEEKEN